MVRGQTTGGPVPTWLEQAGSSSRGSPYIESPGAEVAMVAATSDGEHLAPVSWYHLSPRLFDDTQSLGASKDAQ